MTPAPGKPIERTETADEYGRREKCFRNHRRHPFTFQSHVTDIQSTRETAEADGFVSQLGLKMVPLPNPQLTGDVFDQHQHHRENLEKLLHDSPSRISLSAPNNFTKELLFPVGELDLGSCHENDVQEYLRQVHTKRYSDPFKQWIPLAYTRPDRDESLSFPPGLTLLWELLHRELDTDKPTLSEDAVNLVREQSKSLTVSEHEFLPLEQTKIKPYQYSCLDPISPPLSPVSDDTVPFIPDGGAAVVDLVSEPSSPGRTALEAIQRDMDSDPIISSTFMTSPAAGELPQLFQTCHTLFQEAKVEAPVVFTSSDTLSEANAFTDIHLPLIGDDGIIITNLLKVRQRSLPGSQSQTPLRERVQKVSQKYETLIVLVSESQPKGEFMGTMAPSDTAAYAEFLSFAVALDGDVDVHFIPGATDTMASWVLAFMCQHSSRSQALSRFLSSEETPWELFLRRAGMNVTAAKSLVDNSGDVRISGGRIYGFYIETKYV
ncbi:hypothetical protein TsFJ059_009929 [Trichoderma semiorbis]|uniref:Uncharacterized protein n=1 Tax=Trichoderma semiorbis TaxID=1491008 RepID=A0A9P8KS23_9HYPO|nr:hypothetical protein TsFJ059_009929 [Trichoderma semiorbis]